MTRDTSQSLTDRYMQLICKLAGEAFTGDMAVARAFADDALVTCLMSEYGFFEDGYSREAELPDGIQDIVRSMGNPAEDLGRLLEVSGTRVRSQRSRDAGVIYTPPAVARFISAKTVEQWLLRQVNGRSDHRYNRITDLCKNGVSADLQRAREALDSVQVLDSSCGTGIFLQAAAESLCSLKAACGEDGKSREQLLKETLESNIKGIDIDRKALKAARARLALMLRQAGYAGGMVPALSVEEANPLLLSEKREGQFDIIVGNPPYMRVKSMYSGQADCQQLRRAFARELLGSGLYRLQEGNLNLYKLFIERNLSLLKEDGSMGLIIPSSFLNEATSAPLRQHLFHTCAVEEIVEIPEKARAFGTVSQATAILTCHRGEAGSRFSLRLGADSESLDGETISVDLEELRAITRGRMEVPLLTAPAVEWEMLKHLQKVPPFCGNERFPEVGTICVGQLDETLDKEFISVMPTENIFVKGVHLAEYAVDLTTGGASPRWADKQAFLRKRPSASEVIESPRIIGRNTLNKACSRRLKFALLPAGYVCGNSIKQITIKDPEIQPLYLLGLLNSSVLNWHFEVFCSQNNVRNYCIEALPIPRAPKPAQDAIAYVAKAITETSGEAREYLDKRLMDALVYELYFMDMRMLSSAVLAAIDEQAGPEALMQEDIRRIVDLIAGREGFKITQQVTYRL